MVEIMSKNKTNQQATTVTSVHKEKQLDSSTKSCTHKASQKLFGQDIQQEQLLDYLRWRVQKGVKPELTIIQGASGTGKSSLARTLIAHCDFFLLGKCDQIYKGSSSSSSQQPFKPFVDALTQLVDQVFQKEPEIIQRFKSLIQKTFVESTETNLLIDMIPALVKFFPTKQNQGEDVTFMQHPDGENPTIIVVCKFLQSICSMKHPIVLVIDDVQWIDSSSLELLDRIAREKNMAGFMLVATCRDDEVTADHPFSQTIRRMEQGDRNLSVNYISVENLSAEAVEHITAEKFPTLRQPGLEALSGVLYRRTKGNAFFVSQLLQSLESSGWKVPDQQRRQEQRQIEEWDFDENRSMLDRMIALDCDKLVDVVMVEISNKSHTMKEVLKSACCLGADFVSAHLRMVVEASNHEILEALQMMEEQEFIIRRRGGLGWSWVHDKYQRAAYLLIDPNERKLFHLKIGRRMLANLSEDEVHKYIFILVSQFCIGLKYLEENEKENVAKLSLRAGKRSAQSSSFVAASSYLSMGTSLLNKDNWQSQYDLSLLLYNAAAEVECCRGRFDETDKLVNVILRHAHSFEDQLRAYETKIYALSVQQEINQSVVLALNVLEKLGEKFPKKVKTVTVMYEVVTTKWKLSRKTEEDLMNLPPLNDWKKIAVLRILQLAFPSLVRGQPALAALVTCRCMKLILRDGICGAACAAFVAMGMVLIHPFGFFEETIKCARIGEKIMEKYHVDEMKCWVKCVSYGFCLPYKESLRNTLQPLESAAPVGLLTGDLDMSCLSLEVHAITAHFCGLPLDGLLPLTMDYIKKFQGWGQQVHASHLLIPAQTLENLVKHSADPCVFAGTILNEEVWKEKSELVNDESEVLTFWLYKSFISTYMGEYTRADEFVETMMKQNLIGGNVAMLYQIHFLAALVDLIVARETTSKKAKKYMSSLTKLCSFSKRAPENVMNKIRLIEAEKLAWKDDKKHAILKFKESIELANQHFLLHEEALANERLAIALMEWGDITQALEYFGRANSLYKQWGSPVKVEKLNKFVEEKTGVAMPPITCQNISSN